MPDRKESTPKGVQKLLNLRNHWIAQIALLLIGLVGGTAGVLGNIDTIKSFFGSSTKDKVVEVHGNQVSSTNQSGGITANTVNVDHHPPRHLSQQMANSIVEKLPKGQPVRVVCEVGDREVYAYAIEITNYLKSVGFSATGPGRSLFHDTATGVIVDPNSAPPTVAVRANPL